MLLIDDLLLVPYSGFKFILRTLQRVSHEQYTDDTALKESLLELHAQLDAGEITEEEYVRREGEILRDLREIEERKRELAGGGRRGPLSGKVAQGSGASVHLSYGERRK